MKDAHFSVGSQYYVFLSLMQHACSCVRPFSIEHTFLLHTHTHAHTEFLSHISKPKGHFLLAQTYYDGKDQSSALDACVEHFVPEYSASC